MSARRLVVLCWHNVRPTWFFPGPPNGHLRGLVAQLRLLRRICRPVALEPALDDLFAGRPLPARALAVTFDDGYRDNLDQALPALDDAGVPASFYLVSGFLDGEAAPWWERLGWAFARSPRRGVPWRDTTVTGGSEPAAVPDFWAVAETLKPLTTVERNRAIDELVEALGPEGPEPNWQDMFVDWDGARELARRAEVGCHTRYHGILSRESPSDQAAEIDHSCARLRAELDQPIRTLAYPNGTEADYDEGSVNGAIAAGLDYALTTRAGICSDDSRPFEIERLVLDPLEGAAGLRRVLRLAGVGSWLRGA